VYILGVESGFTSDGGDNHCSYTSFDLKNIERIVPQVVARGLSNKGECTFPLHLGPLTKCVLYIKLSGKSVVYVYLSSAKPLVTFSIILDTSIYITNTTLEKRKLKELSALCKNALFYPMKSFYLDMHNVEHPACLLELPIEIIRYTVLSFLKSTCDLFNFRASCRYFWNDQDIRYYYCKRSMERLIMSMRLCWLAHNMQCNQRLYDFLGSLTK
jgi:hypothetical protein